MEQWKEIEGYESYYISSEGKVKNKNGKIMKPVINNSGYYSIGLYNKAHKRKFFLVHRLVALAFIPNSDPEKNQVNHKSEIKTDNKINNLEWCTAKYNTNYGTRNERASKHFYKKVLCIETGEIFESAVSAAKYCNFNIFTISNAANPNHKTKTAAGFHWQYIN